MVVLVLVVVSLVVFGVVGDVGVRGVGVGVTDGVVDRGTVSVLVFVMMLSTMSGCSCR